MYASARKQETMRYRLSALYLHIIYRNPLVRVTTDTSGFKRNSNVILTTSLINCLRPIPARGRRYATIETNKGKENRYKISSFFHGMVAASKGSRTVLDSGRHAMDSGSRIPGTGFLIFGSGSLMGFRIS